MDDSLRKMFDDYVREVATPICQKNYETQNEKNNAWKLESFRFFYRKGKEYFSTLGLGYDDCEIRLNSGYLRQIDPDFCEKYLERFMEEPNENPPGEYLVDLCWRRWDNNHYRTDLALELEWDPISMYTDWGEDIGEEDFDEDIFKLLDIKAPWKVCVLGCCLDADDLLMTRNQEELMRCFSKYVRSGDYTGEGFLIIFVDKYANGGTSGYLVDDNGECVPTGAYSHEELRTF